MPIVKGLRDLLLSWVELLGIRVHEDGRSRRTVCCSVYNDRSQKIKVFGVFFGEFHFSPKGPHRRDLGVWVSKNVYGGILCECIELSTQVALVIRVQLRCFERPVSLIERFPPGMVCALKL